MFLPATECLMLMYLFSKLQSQVLSIA